MQKIQFYCLLSTVYCLLPTANCLLFTANAQWFQGQKVYGGGGDDQASALQQTNDGGYIVAGSTFSYGAGDKDVYLIKIDAVGDIRWSKTYGGPIRGMALHKLRMGDILWQVILIVLEQEVVMYI